MRRGLRLVVLLLFLALVAGGIWGYLNRQQIVLLWKVSRIGSAANFAAAQPQIAWFDREPDRTEKVRQLVRRWGRGNANFDLYLARYVCQPESSETLREAFSLEFGWREELLPRWAHYWCWQAPEEPDRQIAEILAYLDLLAAADPAKQITWREVLDLQAILQLGGEGRLARRLKPDGWLEPYRRWRESHPQGVPHTPRPATPLPQAASARPRSRGR